ncbi:MAG TPA: ABC transporter permease [Candidatus Dormibacteraeota bacterium]|nr:ABC transporter permease [Candidatus Dormibacteraeota bacterium]
MPVDAGIAGADRRLRRRRPHGWISGLGVLALLEALSRSGVLPPAHFPPPSLTLATLGLQLGSAEFWAAVGQTLEGWASGLLLAALLALPLGMVIGASDLAYRAIRVPLEFLRPIPSVALIPLAILVYGTGFTSKLFLVVFASFWPLFIQVLYGMRDIDPLTMDTARSFGLRRLERVRHVILPSTLPYLATGLRLSSAVALILGVTAELVIGSPGLGREIDAARMGGNDRLMYALIATTGVLGWSINTLFSRLERRLLHWHPSQRTGGRGR